MTALLIRSTRARILAIIAAAILLVVTIAALVILPSLGAHAAQGGPVDALTQYYVCGWRTEWYDPFNWFGTGRSRCWYEWR